VTPTFHQELITSIDQFSGVPQIALRLRRRTGRHGLPARRPPPANAVRPGARCRWPNPV